MFNKIQNKLLLRHPLLWNLRIVPVLSAIILLHILFFFTGYLSGIIDFKQKSFQYFNYENTAEVIFFNILCSVFVIIIWLVFYFRNNAFKTFYPKKRTSLYKEWGLIAIICILNCGYTISFNLGKQIKQRSYFSEKEFSRSIDVISAASTFVVGPFEKDSISYKYDSGNRLKITSKLYYGGKQRYFTSLYNKALLNFSYQDNSEIEKIDMKVKNWLTNNQKDSVLRLMEEFEKIAKRHNLKSSVSPQQWLELVYDSPEFINYAPVEKEDSFLESYDNSFDYDYYSGESNNDDTDVVMPVKQYDKRYDKQYYSFEIIEGRTYIRPKYYVPLVQLKSSYGQISSAWIKPLIDIYEVLFVIYAGLVLAMAIFSFRITSGRSWLISLVALGVTGMLTGLFSLIADVDAFTYIWLLITVILCVGFISFSRAKSKANSAIVLNIFLWLLIWFNVLLCAAIIDILQPPYNIDWDKMGYNYPVYNWLTSNRDTIMFFNILFVIVLMYFITVAIKKWKGIAED